MPEVSVIVPTYNRAQVLRASLESLLSQQHPDGTPVDLEVIVVDDGSSDDTPAVLAGFDDPRLTPIIRPHAGIATSRNAGVAAASAPFIAFHDSDDQALPGRLALPLAYLRAHPGIDLVIQNGRMLAPEDDPTAPEEPWIAPAVARALAARPIGFGEVFRWNLGQLQGMCFTRRSLEAIGPLDASFDILDDLDLVLRVAIRFQAVFLDLPAFAYRRHSGGIARNREKVRAESIRLADKLAREFPEAMAQLGPGTFARRQARRLGKLAEMRLGEGDASGAREALDRARALRPAHLGYRMRALWLRLRHGRG
jgi:glycosyltransferase involved in cell wall biosynthesis